MLPRRIVFLGDSITDGHTYPALIEQGLKAASRRPPVCVNAGIGGDTAAGMLARLQRDVLVHEPDLCTLHVGANDVLRGVTLADYERDVTAIASQLQAAKVPLLILTCCPMGPKQAAAHAKLDE
jgi:acyl-CoA thioesterase-1